MAKTRAQGASDGDGGVNTRRRAALKGRNTRSSGLVPTMNTSSRIVKKDIRKKLMPRETPVGKDAKQTTSSKRYASLQKLKGSASSSSSSSSKSTRPKKEAYMHHDNPHEIPVRNSARFVKDLPSNSDLKDFNVPLSTLSNAKKARDPEGFAKKASQQKRNTVKTTSSPSKRRMASAKTYLAQFGASPNKEASPVVANVSKETPILKERFGDSGVLPDNTSKEQVNKDVDIALGEDNASRGCELGAHEHVAMLSDVMQSPSNMQLLISSAEDHPVNPSLTESLTENPDCGDDCCGVCKKTGDLRLCDGNGCSRKYHVLCLDPIFRVFSPGFWLCMHCVKRKIHFGPYSVSKGVESILDVKQGMQNAKYYLLSTRVLHMCIIVGFRCCR